MRKPDRFGLAFFVLGQCERAGSRTIDHLDVRTTPNSFILGANIPFLAYGVNVPLAMLFARKPHGIHRQWPEVRLWERLKIFKMNAENTRLR